MEAVEIGSEDAAVIRYLFNAKKAKAEVAMAAHVEYQDYVNGVSEKLGIPSGRFSFEKMIIEPVSGEENGRVPAHPLSKKAKVPGE